MPAAGSAVVLIVAQCPGIYGIGCRYFVTFNLVNGATAEQRVEFDRKAQGIYL